MVAVVLGGAALAGGKGSFIGVMLRALLLQETVSIVPFLQRSDAWNTWFLGLLLVAAGIVYGFMQVRKNSVGETAVGTA